MLSPPRPSTLDPVPAEIAALLRTIDEAAAAKPPEVDQLPRILFGLRDHARAESVTASSALDGVWVDPHRAAGIIAGLTQRLTTRGQKELAGYAVAFDHLHGPHASELTVGLIQHLHRLLFSKTSGVGSDEGGTFATDEAASAVAELVERTNAELASGRHHPLIISATCVLDLTGIQPFADGNGRVARLLTTHLLESTGYRVGRYVSIDQLLYEANDAYDDARAASTHEPWPWTAFFLTEIAEAYRRFAARVTAGTNGSPRRQRVADYILHNAPPTFTFTDLRRAIPDVSDSTLKFVLVQLRDAGRITATGRGRGAAWVRH